MRNSLALLSLCAVAASGADRLTLEQALSLALDSNRTYRISVLEARTAAALVEAQRHGW